MRPPFAKGGNPRQVLHTPPGCRASMRPPFAEGGNPLLFARATRRWANRASMRAALRGGRKCVMPTASTVGG